MACRSKEDIGILKKRQVNLKTNYLFVTFSRGDLAMTPAEAAAENSGIKPVNYGWQAKGADPATFRNANFKIDLSGEDRTLPPVTLVIAPYKADCKMLREILLQRDDYKALMYSAKKSELADQWPNGDISCRFETTVYSAADAYAFEYAHSSLLTPPLYCVLRATLLISSHMHMRPGTRRRGSSCAQGLTCMTHRVHFPPWWK